MDAVCGISLGGIVTVFVLWSQYWCWQNSKADERGWTELDAENARRGFGPGWGERYARTKPEDHS